MLDWETQVEDDGRGSKCGEVTVVGRRIRRLHSPCKDGSCEERVCKRTEVRDGGRSVTR